MPRPPFSTAPGDPGVVRRRDRRSRSGSVDGIGVLAGEAAEELRVPLDDRAIRLDIGQCRIGLHLRRQLLERERRAIDWVPAGGSDWKTMYDQRFVCATFGEPIETSVYFFDHHRYDAVELVVTEQRGAQLTTQAHVSGDIDGLGIPEIPVEATVAFGGVYVQTDAVGTDTGSAAELLGRFIGLDGLRPRARSHNVLFEPSD